MWDLLTWFGQELLSHWLIPFIIMVASTVIGIIRRYWPKVADIVGYALVGLGIGIICILLLALAERQKEIGDDLTERSEQHTKALKQQAETLEKLIKQKPTRPYFTQKQTDIRNLMEGIQVLSVTVQNNDIPTRDVVSQLVVIDESLDPTKKPIHTQRIVNANDIGPHGTYFQYWLVKIQKTARPMFVIFQIRHIDTLTDKTYSQALFLKFLGASKSGNFIQQLMHASREEKTRMERYMRDRGIPSL